LLTVRCQVFPHEDNKVSLPNIYKPFTAQETARAQESHGRSFSAKINPRRRWKSWSMFLPRNKPAQALEVMVYVFPRR
jgi:hypothetical protein